MLKNVTMNSHFNENALTMTDMDASNVAIGVILQQNQNGQIVRITMASRKFNEN